MTRMNSLHRLWADGRFPIRDGLYLADGRAWSVRVDPEAADGGISGLTLLEPFDLNALLAAEPEMPMTSFVVTQQVELPGGGGFLFCGEGSWGSEGLFGRLSETGEPVWVVYLELANPFAEIEMETTLEKETTLEMGTAPDEGDTSGPLARFRSTAGIAVTFPVRWTGAAAAAD